MLLTYYKMIEYIFSYLRWWRDKVSLKTSLFFHFWKKKWAIKDIYYILLRHELRLNSATKLSKKIQFVLMAEALTVLNLLESFPASPSFFLLPSQYLVGIHLLFITHTPSCILTMQSLWGYIVAIKLITNQFLRKWAHRVLSAVCAEG